MASAILDTSGRQMLMGPSGVAKGQCMNDPFVPLKAQEYRRNLGARMIALDKPAMKEKLPACDSFVTRKIDGEFTLVLVSGNECCSVNPGGVVRHGLPFMEEACQLASKANVKQLLIAGELYVSRKDRRPRVHDVSRV